jgi:hypothetical protein
VTGTCPRHKTCGNSRFLTPLAHEGIGGRRRKQFGYSIRNPHHRTLNIFLRSQDFRMGNKNSVLGKTPKKVHSSSIPPDNPLSLIITILGRKS